MRVERVDAAVLNTLGGDVLRPSVVMAVLDGVLEAMSPRTRARDVGELRTELTGLDRELARLSNAIAAGGELGPLLDALRVRHARRDEVLAALAARESFDVQRFDRAAIEAKVREYIGGWRALLTKRVEDGRQLLREVLAGPIRFTPENAVYRFEGEAAMGRLLAGIVGLPPFVASPTGFEPVFRP